VPLPCSIALLTALLPRDVMFLLVPAGLETPAVLVVLLLLFFGSPVCAGLAADEVPCNPKPASHTGHIVYKPQIN